MILREIQFTLNICSEDQEPESRMCPRILPLRFIQRRVKNRCSRRGLMPSERCGALRNGELEVRETNELLGEKKIQNSPLRI